MYHRHGDITARDIMSVGQNDRRDKMSRKDKMSGRTKRPAGQKVGKDKTSGRTKRPEGQNIWNSKRLCRQNVQRDKTSFWLIFNIQYIGAATQRQIAQRNCHKTFMLLNVYVPKRIITKLSCHTTKAVIKRQTSQKVNITTRQMFQNITSQNENCHKTTKNV
jgi:hypothetical protein